jgi:hypothetical protein
MVVVETSHAERVREHVRREYVEPARRRHEAAIRVVAGEVQKAVGLSNRVPLVCQALKSHKFLDENHLVLEKLEGPSSGMSTTVVFTYRLLDDAGKTSSESAGSLFLQLRGIGKEVFQSLGGDAEIIRKEREELYGPVHGE